MLARPPKPNPKISIRVMGFCDPACGITVIGTLIETSISPRLKAYIFCVFN